MRRPTNGRYRGLRFAASLTVAGLCLTLIAAPASAGVSSWFSRSSDAPEESAPKRQSIIPKSQPSPKPEDQPGASNGGAVRGSAGQQLVPPTGDDAAYTAFDQGQYLTALKLAKAAALKGEPQANTLIGRIYAEGLGVNKDEKLAVDWFRRGSELGDVQGSFALGLMLAEGRGIKKDLNKAAELFEKAALTGHAEANYNLGLMFLGGKGKPELPIRAYQHIRFAAEKGVVAAMYDLAAMYQAGAGVAPDALETARWLSRAASRGYAPAEYDYAVLLLKGFGLKKDEPKAIAYLKAAAEKGIPGAQNRMAYIYLEGVGTDRDKVEAAKWRLIAKKNGFTDKTLDGMVAKLSKADRARAVTEASAWADRIQVQAVE